jgi:nitroreductase
MNDFLTLIKERRSVREYSKKKIERKILEEIIDCARLAPSSRNVQPWHFVVVTDESKLSKISELPSLGSPFIKNAAACIIVCVSLDSKRGAEDSCLASENAMLAAKSLGIGSCYVAAMGKDVAPIRSLLGIPENVAISCLISLGYYDKNPKTPEKRKLDEVIHWEKFQ